MKMQNTVLDIEDIGFQPNHELTYHKIPSSQRQFIQKELVTWYVDNRRRLPWRGDQPPYEAPTQATKIPANPSITSFFKPETNRPKATKMETIPDHVMQTNQVNGYGTWVSEVMLQQTRVETVIAYYIRWMNRFPTVQTLAEATEEQVNELWAGLGYYRRARMLRQGAQYVVNECDGQLPKTVKELLKVPGIGPYTAGAIASIAFNKPTALVDGNVIRVFSRLRAIHSDPKDKQLVDYCWQLAHGLIDREHPGDFNQGLMELGATVCKPKNPDCAACPLISVCKAYAQVCPPTSIKVSNENCSAPQQCSLCKYELPERRFLPASSVMEFPSKATRTKQREEVLNVSVVSGWYQDERHYLVIQRPDTGLLAKQWEFPTCLVAKDNVIPPHAERISSVTQELKELVGNQIYAHIDLTARVDAGQVNHVFSHVRHYMGIETIELKPSLTTLDVAQPKNRDLKWMTLAMILKKGMTTGMKKIFQHLKHLPSVQAKTKRKRT